MEKDDYCLVEKKECNKKQIIFIGCGGMISYYFGIAKYIQDNFNLENIIFGGVSGGSIISFYLSLEKDMELVFKDASKELCNNLTKSSTGALFNMIDLLNKYLDRKIKEEGDEYLYKILNKKELFISISTIYPRKNLISNWKSNIDLIDCILASCSLPLLGHTFFNNYRDNYCLDGAFYNNNPRLYSELPILIITPYKWRLIPPSWFSFCCDKEWHSYLFELGYNDAKKNKEEFENYLEKINKELIDY